MTPKRQNDCARTVEIFNRPGAFLWINFAELAGKYRSGQPALTSTGTLLFGTTICSCFVGMGGFLYWRRAFWICCLTSSRAASSVGGLCGNFGKVGNMGGAAGLPRVYKAQDKAGSLRRYCTASRTYRSSCPSHAVCVRPYCGHRCPL